MPVNLTLTVDGNTVTVTDPPGGAAVRYDVIIITRPGGTVVSSTVWTTVWDDSSSTSQVLEASGNYHVRLTGSDGSQYDWDITIPTNSP
ncbi:MAG: hypothetical protein K2X87_33860 [Gemmataceae bacterium]|nr:hypothetical protein [Gemmataceae bacterium]